jgi:DNA invertase Pin-like site-specific DNA recombinase
MLGVSKEFETNLRRERQMEGIARAKANGAYAGKGRPASIEAARVREMKAQGLGRYSNRQGARHRPGERLSRRLIATSGTGRTFRHWCGVLAAVARCQQKRNHSVSVRAWRRAVP